MAPRLFFALSVIGVAGCAGKPTAPAPARLPQVPVTAKADRSEDPQLRDAMSKAQATLEGFVSRLRKPQRGETFSVEGKFKAEDDSPIYLWLGDVSFANDAFTGTITTHPKKASRLKFGDTATVRKEDVSDWMILKGGRSEGGFTIEILMQREAAPK